MSTTLSGLGAGDGHASPGPAAVPHSGGSCAPVAFPVDLAGVGYQTIRGTLCLPTSATATTLEILLSGLTYDSVYWQLPPAPGEPSYQRALTAAGYATLALDRLGTGRSDRPPAADVTFDSEIDTLHQVISAVGGEFGRVVLVGHSFGSALAVGEAADYGDAAAIVLSGWAHAEGSAGTSFEQVLVAADSDPVTGPTDPPRGYLTTKVGSRATFFYNTSDAYSGTIDADEATKSTMTTGELDSLSEPYDPALAAKVTVPVLLAIGQDDVLTCGSQLTCSSAAEVRDYERQLFGNAPELDAYLLPGAGHAINLAGNAPLWFAESEQWTNNLP